MITIVAPIVAPRNRRFGPKVRGSMPFGRRHRREWLFYTLHNGGTAFAH
jgi:hypothetical protein